MLPASLRSAPLAHTSAAQGHRPEASPGASGRRTLLTARQPRWPTPLSAARSQRRWQRRRPRSSTRLAARVSPRPSPAAPAATAPPPRGPPVPRALTSWRPRWATTTTTACAHARAQCSAHAAPPQPRSSCLIVRRCAPLCSDAASRPGRSLGSMAAKRRHAHAPACQHRAHSRPPARHACCLTMAPVASESSRRSLCKRSRHRHSSMSRGQAAA